ncbi:hypothetical protein ACJX0J_030666, partial [Zea mays]
MPGSNHIRSYNNKSACTCMFALYDDVKVNFASSIFENLIHLVYHNLPSQHLLYFESAGQHVSPHCREKAPARIYAEVTVTQYDWFIKFGFVENDEHQGPSPVPGSSLVGAHISHKIWLKFSFSCCISLPISRVK